MTRRPLRPLLALLPLLTFLQAGCSSDQLPNDAQLSVSPDSHSIDIVELRDASNRCLFNPDQHVDLPLVLELTGNGGSPIGDADINVYVDFAGNTFTGFPVLSLYEDRNNNGVVDADSELVSGPDDDIAVVKTGKYTGSHQMLLRINLSCGFRGGVYAVVGGIVANSSIAVNDTSEAGPDSDSFDVTDRDVGDRS